MSKEIPDTYLERELEKFKPVKLYILLFSFATNILMLMLPIFSLQVLDRVISSGSYETLLMLSLVALVAFIFYGFFGFVRSLIQVRIGEWFEVKLHPRVLSKTISLSTIQAGTSGSQPVRDLQVVRSFFAGPTYGNLIDSPWALIFIIVVFMIHPVTGFFTLAGSIALLGLAFANELATRSPLALANERQIKNLTGLEMASRNAEAVEAMGMEQSLIKRWDEKNTEVLDMQNLASNRSNVIMSFSKVFRMFLQVGIMGIGAYLVLNNQLSVGGIIACSILSARALAPFEQAIGTWTGYRSYVKARARLNEFFLKVPDRKETLSLPEPKGVVHFEKVIFTPPGATKPVLKGINFTLAAGDSLGIIGPSAAGKSTLARLLVGIWAPQSGTVRLDGADVYTWNRDEFGKYVGYLPQDVELFEGTVKENIARMEESPSDEDIIKAAQMADVHDLILRLPEGYETDIGAGGTSLSAGQRQRIGLARAFYGDPKLIVLDEPNANLDDAGEAALIKSLQNAKQKGITLLVVSHRPNLLSHVDYLMVMREGQVADFGDSKEIIAKFSQQAQQQRAQLQQAPQQAAVQQQGGAAGNALNPAKGEG